MQDQIRPGGGEPSFTYRHMIEKLPAGAYACDADGLIVYFNQQAVRLWGREPKLLDPVDRYCGSFKLFDRDGNPIPHSECWMARALKTGGEYDGEEIIIERPDGSRVTALAHASPLRDEQGRLLGAVNILVDISDRKKLEEALREADRRKDEFLAVLAHELRNPLAPISNSLHILRLSDDLSPGVERVREIMERQVNHLTRLVDDLMEVSRISRGKIELRKEPIDLAAVIRNAVETSRPAIDAAGHQLAIAVPPVPVMIEGDSVRLAQVIGNLLNNAAKYTPKGGQIWLTARLEGDTAVVSVRDTGIGIPPEKLPRVFDMFSQVDPTTSRSQGGLGIGLTLARSLVELHGGTVEVYSDGAERGSEFVVRLPALQSNRTEDRNSANRSFRQSAVPHRILVVDDTPAAAFILGKLLQKMGHEVFTIQDAEAAVECVRTKRPDVVISDIAMPRIDGYELARRLRSEAGFDKLTLVALTGYGRPDDRERAREAGFDLHLVKPVSLEALEEVLEALDEQRTAGASSSH